MLYAVLSDIHANLEALQAVLRFLKRKPVQGWLLLGDLVGYGASPNQVVERLQRLHPRYVIRGNHDRVAAGLGGDDDFNEVAAESIAWTQRKLHPRHRGFLRHLPVGPLAVNEHLSLCHGTPFDEDVYILSDYDAYIAFQEHPARILFFGHTHLPVVYRLREQAVDTFLVPPARVVRVPLDPRFRYLINPGSVGQPRDRVPLASFCMFDARRWRVTFYRLPYDISRAQQRILRAGLPEFLALRLAYGV